MKMDEDIGLIQICKLSSWQWPMRGQWWLHWPMRGPDCPHVLSPGLVWSPDPASDTTHHRGTAIMMTEDLMTTNIRGERPNLSYKDRDVNISIHSQQPVHVLKRSRGRFYVVVLPKYNWAYLHGLKDAGALAIQDSICGPRGSLGIRVKKCGLLVRCNIWEIISRLCFVASSAWFCLFNEADTKKSSWNERNFLFVCFEANGSLGSSRAEDNWSIIVTKLSQNCVWMANNEGGRTVIKLPGPGQRGTVRPHDRGWTGSQVRKNWEHEKLSQPLPPPFLNHGTQTRDWEISSQSFILKQRGQEKRKCLKI